MEKQVQNDSKALQTSSSVVQRNGSQKAVVSLSERYKEVTTIAQAFNLPEAPLAKTQGNVKDSIMIHLSALARFLGLKATLTDEHIEFIADKILSDEYYKWIKPADLKIFFDRIKTGKYGDFYGNLNSISFFQSLDKYMIERNGEIERLREQEAKQQRTEMRDVNLNYYLDENANIITRPDYSPDKPKEKKDTDKAAKVAHMARVFVSQGMSYHDAIAKAASQIDNPQNQ